MVRDASLVSDAKYTPWSDSIFSGHGVVLFYCIFEFVEIARQNNRIWQLNGILKLTWNETYISEFVLGNRCTLYGVICS